MEYAASTKVSKGTRQGQGPVNNGHPAWGWASTEAAPFARRCNPRVQHYDHRRQTYTNVSVAPKTVAHKFAYAC